MGCCLPKGTTMFLLVLYLLTSDVLGSSSRGKIIGDGYGQLGNRYDCLVLPL